MDQPPIRRRRFTREEIRYWQQASAEESLREGERLFHLAFARAPDKVRRRQELKRRLLELRGTRIEPID